MTLGYLANDVSMRPRIAANVVAAGSGVADATYTIGQTWLRVTSVPKGSGVKLLPAEGGLLMTVTRADRTNSNVLAIYPQPGDTIDGGSVIAIAGSIQLFAFVPGQWSVVAASVEPFFIDILPGLGAVWVAAVQDMLGVAKPPGAGAIAAAMVQRQLGSITLTGGGSAHA
jgi:hypothetical protein